MIKIFQRDVNPSSERLRAKLSDLEAHQTPSTALGFYNTIIEIFMNEGITLRRPIFLPKISYSLTFRADYETMIFVCDGIFHGTATTASFGVMDKDNPDELRQFYSVSTLPARRIRGLAQDILIKRIKPNERMPIFAMINGQRYPINYRNAIDIPTEGRIS
jgi:hypothetical protein